MFISYIKDVIAYIISGYFSIKVSVIVNINIDVIICIGDKPMHSSGRILTTISPFLKEKLVQLSEKFGCSQAEVVRIALVKLWEEEK